MMVVSKKIKQICIDKDMTQKELAERHGDAYQTFKNKLGRNKMRFSEVEQIMDVLDCDVVFKDRKTGKEY